jgi:mono/diheme cytochrome c family protein
MRSAWCIAVLAFAGACRTKDGKLAEDHDAGAAALSTASSAPSDRGPELVAAGCLACHSEEMLREQRLTPAQWEKVVKKMAGWGANIAADDVPVVSAYLAAGYGLDAGAYQVATVAAARASGELAPTDDGAFAAGSADRGGSLYGARCASCHGADARGQIGVNLVDRPLLYRAADFAQTIRAGRAKMPAQPSTTEGEVADLLAHLRRVRPAR